MRWLNKLCSSATDECAREWKRLGKLCLFSFLTLLFLGGAVESLGYYVSGFSGESRVTLFVCLISISLAYGGFSLWQRRLSRHLESAVIPLSLRYRGESEEMYALVDSGSFLKEPESGDPVLLLKAEYCGKFFTSQELSRIRLGQGEKQGLLPIPVRTASGTGLFYAFRPEKAFLWKKRLSSGKREIRCVVALDFSPGGFAGCPCLIPLSVL